MSTKTVSKPKTKTKAQTEEVELEHSFSFEFLDALADTAEVALSDHLKEIKASRDVRQLVGMISCLYLEMIYLLEGREQDPENIADYVVRTVHSISALGGTWHSPTGSVTPLKKRPAMIREERLKKATNKTALSS